MKSAQGVINCSILWDSFLSQDKCTSHVQRRGYVSLAHAISLVLQSACIQFYRRFLESPNFSSWFERRRGRASLWQECSWAEAALERGKEVDFEDCSEVRLIEAFAALEKKLEATLKAEDASPSVRQPLVKYISMYCWLLRVGAFCICLMPTAFEVARPHCQQRAHKHQHTTVVAAGRTNIDCTTTFALAVPSSSSTVHCVASQILIVAVEAMQA